MQNRSQRVIGSILLFVMVQIAWFALLGIWIYWYVANYITFTEISERVYPQISFNTQNVAALVGGIVLLVGVSGGISVLFGVLRRQFKVTKMYDSFIANVTHELKSPLASIEIHIETLLTRAPSAEEVSKFLELMQKDAARLDTHISSILDVARLEEHKSALQLEETDADSLFHSLFSQASDRFGLSGENFKIEGSARCAIHADERALGTVINNLIENAVKYSVDGPMITMQMKNGVKRLTVSVSDEGVGISAADQKKVFRKFVRLENPESPSVKGTGLGLYWVREIVRHHGGRVSVASAGEGAGSTFSIELPIVRKGIPLRGKSERDL